MEKTKKEPEITPELVASHGLSEEEYGRVLKILGRTPTYTELGIFSVMWSEHCSYKSSRKHLSRFPTKAPWVIQGPGENAGVIDIGDGLAAVFKMESHNHPSFIEPYQGAATGVGGILRDVFTMGARPIANMDSLRFGPLSVPKNQYLLDGVVAGIAGYGNCMGIPTIAGETYFNEIYNGNNLVNAFTLGIARTDRIFYGTASGVGNPVIYVGSKTGRDGIHGATMASEEFSEGTEEKRPTVQVGDPFTEKLLLEACLELMSKDLIIGIQDMGAAGLTSSSCEMASRGGAGMEMDLSLVPRREEGMIPYELMLSESQERMLIVAKEGMQKEVEDIFKKWDLEAVTIGHVTADGMLRVKDGGAVVAEIPAKAIADEAPVYDRPSARPLYQDSIQDLNLDLLPMPKDLNEVLAMLLDSPTIADKSWIYRQYDHMVRTNTVVYPGSDAGVVRIKGTNKALAMSVDCNSLYCFLHPKAGGAIAVCESARNVVCSGAKPMALTDCLNFGNPEKPETMWQFKEALEGMSLAAEKLGTPVVSGNVSFYNETKGMGIYPTPVIGMVGLMDDVSKATTQYFKDEGDVVILLGESKEEIGGTEFLRVVHGLQKGLPPDIDLDTEKALQDALLGAIGARVVMSAHDCSDGGLAVALAECCFKGEAQPVGCEITVEGNIRKDALLFGESQSRIIISAKPEDAAKIAEIMSRYDVPCKVIGKVGGSRLVIKSGNEEVINQPVARLKEIWREAIPKMLRK
jgi:phosphoribosylformylglycinamidine synthase subunit PurL